MLLCVGACVVLCVCVCVRVELQFRRLTDGVEWCCFTLFYGRSRGRCASHEDTLLFYKQYIYLKICVVFYVFERKFNMLIKAAII